VYTTGSPVFLQEDIPNSTESGAQYGVNYNCALWDSILVYQP
jgi:hypothetical protein